jgi:3-methyladenine DNA glycosylase AlkD
MKLLGEVIPRLEGLADPKALQSMDHFGMATVNRLGIKMPNLRALAKSIGKDHALALQLWDTGIA